MPPPLFGSPAVSRRPVALRSRLATSLPLSQRQYVPAALTRASVPSSGWWCDMPPGHFLTYFALLCSIFTLFRERRSSVMRSRAPKNTSKYLDWCFFSGTLAGGVWAETFLRQVDNPGILRNSSLSTSMMAGRRSARLAELHSASASSTGACVAFSRASKPFEESRRADANR